MTVLLAPLRPRNTLVLGIVEGAAIYHGNLVLHEKFQNLLVFISRNLNILLKFVVNYPPSVLRLLMSGSGHKRTELRPSNRGNIFLQPLVQQTFVALQFAIVCCPCYYLCAKQILMLQKVETASTFCNMNFFFCARRWFNKRHQQSQLATQHSLRDKLQENFARLTLPLEWTATGKRR